MSDIQLSAELFEDIQQAVAKQHPGADAGVVMQYLAAISGYMLGSEHNMQANDKEEFLQELCGFMQHVYTDTASRQQQQQAAVADKAFGYWEPK